MKEIKRQVTQEQIVYEISEEELNKIKQKMIERGRKEVLQYLSFTIRNYHIKMNFGGATHFLGELIDFICGQTNTIKNTFGYSFWDYIKQFE